jgi:purine-binding chemotaxis protein CheW
MNQNGNKNLQVVGFKIGKEFFGVDIASVQEIVRVPEITQIPETPPFVEGVINLRGRIIPVIDLRKRLRLGNTERSRASRVLITEEDKRTVGLIVDSASEVLRLPSDSIEPPPEMITGVGVEYITGVGRLDDQIIILLDLTKILDVNETMKLEKLKIPETANKEEAEKPVRAAQGAS